MISLFRNAFGRPQPVEIPPLAPDAPFSAIGDIHGRHDLMLRLVDKLAQQENFGRLIFLGDYVDRGPDSAAVLEALFGLQRRFKSVICLRGNHEEMLLQFMADPVAQGPSWIQFGGRATLQSYGVTPVYPGDPQDDWYVARDQLFSAMGEELLEWIAGLPTIWVSGNVSCVHAGLDPDLSLENQDEAHLLWGHPEFLKKPQKDGLWTIFGHTIVEKVIAEQGRIGVDTGAYATGILSAACVDMNQFKIVCA